MSDTLDSAPAAQEAKDGRPPVSVLAYFPGLEHTKASRWQHVDRSTFLPGADPAQVWEAATRLEGINAELAPVMRMTVPQLMRGNKPSLADVPLGVPLGRSWILLGRLLPYDYDDVTIAEREEGRRFLEVSRMSSAQAWIHERVIEPHSGGAVLTDRLTYLLKPHLRPMTPLYRRTVQQLFAHRHRRVARRFARLAPRPFV
ncbi:hypothetical protein SLNWT_6989 [Streptomyces albus]|uniref:DUF2867 domain-containing protein n=1 Tax=Streptomyces albus (strain ATCC 21838 / DSM 41398 / FERM P-419 / JCM 4703 / NBRC 107858) TaxID=1081613 RepID=A0A0B5F733_STRA4|nr:hypothetical protein SLNWT_6989 [Streptomyces albus]AOU81668.1 hypothetical protein SLNHY_6977 [Streptomyces albus]AYN37357.1 hypothetical protein DUI70_6864 [Streptomyces albus]